MEIIICNNIFEFNEIFLKLNIGAAMGSRPIPLFAKIVMAKIDSLIRSLDISKAKALFKRFLDDLFFLFIGSTKELHELFNKINNLHPTNRFTMNHTMLEHEAKENRCNCPSVQSIPFLDTLSTIKEGKIDINIFF